MFDPKDQLAIAEGMYRDRTRRETRNVMIKMLEEKLAKKSENKLSRAKQIEKILSGLTIAEADAVLAEVAKSIRERTVIRT